MAKCIDCLNYFDTADGKSCSDGGDTSNPEEDYYCATVDGFEGDIDAWEKSRRNYKLAVELGGKK